MSLHCQWTEQFRRENLLLSGFISQTSLTVKFATSTEEVVWTSSTVATSSLARHFVTQYDYTSNFISTVRELSPVAERSKSSLIQICNGTDSRHEAQRRQPVRYVRHVRYQVKIYIGEFLYKVFIWNIRILTCFLPVKWIVYNHGILDRRWWRRQKKKGGGGEENFRFFECQYHVC